MSNKTLKQEIEDATLDLNISNLTIDRESAYKGRSSTMVSFNMHSPMGLDTGILDFEIWLANDMGLSREHKAKLVYSYASAEAKAFVGMGGNE